MRIAGIIRESIVDGPGMRFVIFAQGCPHGCPGCHNPQTHDFEGGFYADVTSIMAEIEKNPLLRGVTFSGGEPFSQAGEFADLAKQLKTKGLDIMTYSGYTFEEISRRAQAISDWKRLLEHTDILADGPFMESMKDLTLRFRGSKNQRLIDVNETMKNNFITEYRSL